MSKLTKLISAIQKDGKMSDQEIIAHLSDSLSEVDEEACKKEYMKLYKEVYGCSLTKDLVDDWVRHMDVPKLMPGQDGMKWNIDACVEYGTKVGVDWHEVKKIDFYAVMNMCYSDYYDTASSYDKGNDPAFYARLAKDWLCDTDVPEGKLFNYYFKVVKGIDS